MRAPVNRLLPNQREKEGARSKRRKEAKGVVGEARRRSEVGKQSSRRELGVVGRGGGRGGGGGGGGGGGEASGSQQREAIMKSGSKGGTMVMAAVALWAATLLGSTLQLCFGAETACSPNSSCQAWAVYRAVDGINLSDLASIFNVTGETIRTENGSQYLQQQRVTSDHVPAKTTLRIPLRTCLCVRNPDVHHGGNGTSNGDNFINNNGKDPSLRSGMVASLFYSNGNSKGVRAEHVAKLFGFLVSADEIVYTNNANRADERRAWNVSIPCKCGSSMGGTEGGVGGPRDTSDPPTQLQFATYVAPDDGASVRILASVYNSSEDLIRQNNDIIAEGENTISRAVVIFIPLDVPQVLGSLQASERTPTPRQNGRSGSQPRSAGPQTAIAILVVGAIVGFLAILLLLFVGILAINGRARRSATGSVRHDSFDICCHLVKSSDSDREKDEKERKPTAGETPVHVGLDLRPADTEKSRVFAYKELAAATNNFSDRYKIGDGGYCAVYRGLLHGKPRAIKKMLGSANREFQLELQVLTKVHHIHLVELVGHCTDNGLYLVYDYMPNGTLSQHLHNPANYGYKPLRWKERVQIALDAARALEYIHEHTTPRYVHRDIKSNNILLDKNMRAKVADFGLTKLIRENSDGNSQTRLVGTFGYMAPEYARFGEISTKVDVYAFGVVLLELVSGKEAIVHRDATGMNGTIISLFAPVWREPSGIECLPALVDPGVRDLVALEDVYKLVILAGKCTDEDPDARPSMRTVVMALMTLSSLSTEWEAGFDADITFAGLLNGR